MVTAAHLAWTTWEGADWRQQAGFALFARCSFAMSRGEDAYFNFLEGTPERLMMFFAMIIHQALAMVRRFLGNAQRYTLQLESGLCFLLGRARAWKEPSEDTSSSRRSHLYIGHCSAGHDDRLDLGLFGTHSRTSQFVYPLLLVESDPDTTQEVEPTSWAYWSCAQSATHVRMD